jgi:hypothetical protein
MRVRGHRHPLATPRPEDTRYSLDPRLGAPEGRFERVRKMSPPRAPPGFEHRAVQPARNAMNGLTTFSEKHIVSPGMFMCVHVCKHV